MKSKIISLDEYKSKKMERKKDNKRHINELKNLEKDDREDTFNLFMRVLSTIREESY